MRLSLGAIIFLTGVFSVAAVFLIYYGATTGNYLLVVLVLVAYTFVLRFEASLISRARQSKLRRALASVRNHA